MAAWRMLLFSHPNTRHCSHWAVCRLTDWAGTIFVGGHKKASTDCYEQLVEKAAAVNKNNNRISTAPYGRNFRRSTNVFVGPSVNGA